MPEIQGEMLIFLQAVLYGMTVRFLYQSIECFREIVKHTHLAVEIEDFLFWIGSAIFLFVQIHHTSNGILRWYLIPGIVGGAFFVSAFLKKIKKMHKKIYGRKRKK